MGFLTKKKLLVTLTLLVLAVSIPLTIFLVQQRQDNRSKASAASTLSFEPIEPTTVGDDVAVGINLDPGNDLVSYVRVQVKFDPNVLQLSTTQPFTPNTNSFPTQIQAPVISPGSITVTVAIGSDITKLIQAPTSVGTVNFKAINASASSTITFGSLSQILSNAPDDSPTDNVLSTTTPTTVTITSSSSSPTATPTPTPATTTGSPTITSGPTSAITPTETVSPTPIPTGIGGGPTSTPSATAVPTAVPTSAPTTTPKTQVALDVLMHAVGSGGDNANPFGNQFSNKNPQNATRSASVSFYNELNAFVGSVSGIIHYSSTSGSFKGVFDVASSMIGANGYYTVRLASDYHLVRRIPGIVQMLVNQKTQLPSVQLVAGDANSDNALNILDYNLLMGCYGSLAAPVSCTAAQKLATDFNDDSNVDHIDYNLFLRELSHNLGD